MMKKLFLLLISMFLFVSVLTVSVRAEEEDPGESLQPGEEQNETVSGETEVSEDEETVVIEEDISFMEEQDSDAENEAPVEESDGEAQEETDEDITEEMTHIDEEELEYCDLSEFIVQEGGFPEVVPEADAKNDSEGSTIISSEFTAAENAMYNGMKQVKNTIDLSAYKITAKQLSISFFKVVNESPELFYVKSSLRYGTSGNYVSKIQFYYYESNTLQQDIAYFNAKVDSIIASVDPGWSDLQKAMYLNDWLCINSDYDFSYKRYNAYNAIVQGSAVCQGQALAYELLLKRAGIECHLVTSKELNHAWNIVSLYGDYYYVDPTWNNGNGVQSWYDYFLCSRDEMYAKGHDCIDWVTNGVSVYEDIETSDRYENYFWKEDFTKPVCYNGHEAVYLYEVMDEVNFDYYIGFFDLDEERLVRSITPMGSKYDMDTFYYSAVIDIDGCMYYNSRTGIYRLDLDNYSQVEVFTLPADQQMDYHLFYLWLKNYRLNYLTVDNASEYAYSGSIGEGTIVKQNRKTGDLIIADDDIAMADAMTQFGSYVDIISGVSGETFRIYGTDSEDLRKEDCFYKVIYQSEEDGHVLIPFEVLQANHIPSGNAVIEMDYNGTHFSSDPIELNACAPAPAVTVAQEGNQLVIESPDTVFLQNLLKPQVYNYKNRTQKTGSTIRFVSDGRLGSIGNQSIITASYETCSEDIVYSNGRVTISSEALIENGIFNGETVTASFSVFGYEKITVSVPGGITIGCVPGTADFTIHQENDGNIIIESGNATWLNALARPAVYYGENEVYSMKDYGRISGTTYFVLNGQNMPLNVSVNNSRYDTREEISYRYEEGKIILPRQTLIDSKIPDGDYELVLHAPGYEDYSTSLHIASPIQAYVPEDLEINTDDIYGIILSSQDTEWLIALQEGYSTISDRNGNTYFIDNPLRSVKENGYLYISAGNLAGAGIFSGTYDVMFAPAGYINYGIRNCPIRIDSSVKKIFIVSFFDEEGELIQKSTVSQGARAQAPELSARKGYHFAGWYMNGKKYDLSKGVADNLDLQARWNENTYKLVYNANGGKGTLEKTTTYKLNDQVTVSSLSPQKNGYAFLGWSLNKDDRMPEYTAGDDITGINLDYGNNVTITLYAIYSDPITYTISLDPKGGTPAPKQSYDSRLSMNANGTYSGTYDVSSTAFKLPKLVKDGYKFNGWYDLNTGKKLSSIAKGSYGDKSLYASFTPVAYKITYTLNKGSIPKDEVYDRTFSIETEEIVLPEPYRKGYTFDGWYLDKALTQQALSIHDLPMKNVKLYAGWIPNVYSITFRSWDHADITLDGYRYDVSYKLDSDIFDVPGKAVSKWTYSYVDAKGKTVTKTIAGNASVKNLVSQDGGNIVLSVVASVNKTTGIETELWKDVTYTIKYSLPKGTTNGSKNPTKYSYTEEENVYMIKNPVRSDCYFLYWTYEDREGETQLIYPVNYDGTKNGYSYLPAGMHQNIVLVAYFE